MKTTRQDHPHKLNGKERSPHWPSVRRGFIKGKACAVCGGTKKMEVHHKKPFHLHPELELIEENLIVLCEGNKNINCHLQMGHFGNYRNKFNPDIALNAKTWNKRFLAKKQSEI